MKGASLPTPKLNNIMRIVFLLHQVGSPYIASLGMKDLLGIVFSWGRHGIICGNHLAYAKMRRKRHRSWRPSFRRIMEWQPPLEALLTAFVRPFCSFNASKEAILRPSCFRDYPSKSRRGMRNLCRARPQLGYGTSGIDSRRQG